MTSDDDDDNLYSMCVYFAAVCPTIKAFILKDCKACNSHGHKRVGGPKMLY